MSFVRICGITINMKHLRYRYDPTCKFLDREVSKQGGPRSPEGAMKHLLGSERFSPPGGSKSETLQSQNANCLGMMTLPRHEGVL